MTLDIPSTLESKSIQRSFSSKREVLEAVYELIKENSGKFRTVDIEKVIRDREDVRFAITRLTVLGRIRRKRGFGFEGVEYFYHDVQSSSYEKFRREELRAFQK